MKPLIIAFRLFIDYFWRVTQPKCCLFLFRAGRQTQTSLQISGVGARICCRVASNLLAIHVESLFLSVKSNETRCVTMLFNFTLIYSNFIPMKNRK